MNIHNVNNVDEPEDRLKAIFDKQASLMEKYHAIEKANGLLQTDKPWPYNLHDAKAQARIKDFAWRTVEEVAEAYWAAIMEGKGWQSDHCREEIADALHFLVELTLMSGVTRGQILDYITDTEEAERREGEDDLTLCLRAVYPNSEPNPMKNITTFFIKLGMVCHTLKNKPWKQSQMLTDIQEFTDRLCSTWHGFFCICVDLELEADELYALYFKKNAVNQFRQRSKY